MNCYQRVARGHIRIVILLLALAISACATSAITHGSAAQPTYVSKLVDDLAKSPRKQRRAVDKLVSMGPAGVPYLIAHLDDTRQLSERSISLENKSPDRFEAVRHYRPEAISDALTAILNDMTGQHFVDVYNGATPKDREDNRRQWRDWCRSAYQDQAEICNGKNRR